jgi:plastocyanin
MAESGEHAPPPGDRQARMRGHPIGAGVLMNMRMRTNYGSPIAVLGMAVLLASCGNTDAFPSQSGGGPGGMPSLEFVTPPKTVTLGSSTPLTVSQTDASGNTTAVTPSWTSTNVQVAAVSDAGILYGVSDGTATITATFGTLTASTDIIVAGSASFPSTAEVDMPAETYSPSELDVAAGAVVSFHFPAEQHNVVFSGSADGTPASVSPTVNTVVNVKFTTRGIFPYVCTIHPGMAGIVIAH